MFERAYYNDSDPFCCAWLSNLMDAGMITPGRIDGRPIQELSPDDVAGFGRVHLFAGIGGWDHALNLAGWGSQPVWTGSCPCQPFSVAGAREGESDKRHLWPEFARLIRLCRPPVVFGEQVASPAGLGWLDAVCSDLEGEGYAVGAADLCAAGVGAPHIRQRLYFVAHSIASGRQPVADGDGGFRAGMEPSRERLEPRQYRHDADSLAYSLPAGRAERWAVTGSGSVARSGRNGFLADTNLKQRDGNGHAGTTGRPKSSDGDIMGDSGCQGLARRSRQSRDDGEEQSAVERTGSRAGFVADANGGDASTERLQRGGQHGQQQEDGGAGPWRCDWLPCRDGKARPVGPGTFPLAHGLPARVVRLRGYGNAIVPQVAAEFIRAYQELE